MKPKLSVTMVTEETRAHLHVYINHDDTISVSDTIRCGITLNMPNDLASSKLRLWHGPEQHGMHTHTEAFQNKPSVFN